MSDNVERRVAEPGAAEPAVGKARRQRRPTGVPPPLPHPVTISARTWLVLVAVGLAAAFVAAQRTSWLRVDDRVSTWVLRQLAGIRTPWLTDVANGINGAGSGWGASVLGLSVVALAMAFRRWRHLAVFVGGLVFLEVVGELVYNGLSRPRPVRRAIIGGWAGYASASPFVGVLTFYLLGIVYCLAAAVVRRLDGIALAIEFAAARASAMTPAELARRLGAC